MNAQFGAMPPEHHIRAGIEYGRRLRGMYVRDAALLAWAVLRLGACCLCALVARPRKVDAP